MTVADRPPMVETLHLVASMRPAVPQWRPVAVLTMAQPQALAASSQMRPVAVHLGLSLQLARQGVRLLPMTGVAAQRSAEGVSGSVGEMMRHLQVRVGGDRILGE